MIAKVPSYWSSPALAKVYNVDLWMYRLGFEAVFVDTCYLKAASVDTAYSRASFDPRNSVSTRSVTRDSCWRVNTYAHVI